MIQSAAGGDSPLRHARGAVIVVLSIVLAASASVSACKRRANRCEQEEKPPEQVVLTHARDPRSRPSGALTEEDLAAFSRFRDDVRSTTVLTVYEGLPATFEDCGELYGRELSSKRAIEIRTFRFYEKPLAVSSDVAATLLGAATSTSTFRGWGAPKGCGFFHPDFALVWNVGGKTYELLLCFGCQEARLSGENIDLWFDIVSAGTFGPTLEPLREHRAPTRSTAVPSGSIARP